MRQVPRLRWFLTGWVAVTVLACPVSVGWNDLATSCLPDEGIGLMWRETFLQTRDLPGAGWEMIGPPSWCVTRESLDAGNGDLFDGTTFILLPPGVAENRDDYLVSTLVWNTQREGYFFLAVRFQDPRNYYACEYVSAGSALAVFLVKMKDGVRTVLDRADNVRGAIAIPDLTYGAGKRNAATVSIGVFGDRICGSVGGVVELSASDSDLVSGRIALAQGNYHPFFDDVSIYLGSSYVPSFERVEGPVEFHVMVPDRDEGNAILVDIREMGIQRCVLEEREEELWIRVGPLSSQQEILEARDYLDNLGYLYDEIQVGSPEDAPADEGAPDGGPSDRPPPPE